MIGLIGKGLFMVSSGFNRLRQRCLSRSLAIGAAFFLAVAAVGTLPVAALGLGEIDTRSALNERFAAEIELLDTRGLDPAEVLASLASTDDFRRVGVERFFFLTSLKFDVTRNARGNLVIKATSLQPITEPYLNFLVEVLWPSGRLLKEYTVLLDPPTFARSSAAPVAAPSREQIDTGSTGRIQRNPVPVDSPASAGNVALAAGASRPATPRPQAASNEATYGRTTRRDTMWSIANQTLPSGNVTPQQNMLAIQRLNPTAFIEGNVNLLKAGVVLRLPNEAQAGVVSKRAAIAEIDRQNSAWRAGPKLPAVVSTPKEPISINPTPTSAATIDATSRGPGDAGSAPTANDGRLRIVAAEATDVVDSIDNAGSGDSATAVAGDPVAQERLADMSRQVDELTYQLDLQKRGIEEQISARENAINLKDRQIAQLEAQLKTLRENVTIAQPQDQSTPQTIPQADALPWWQQASVLGSALGVLVLLLAGVLFSRRRQNSDELDLDDIDATEPSFELGPSVVADAATPLADAELVLGLEDPDHEFGLLPGEAADGDQAEEFDTTMDNQELSDDDLFGPSDDNGPASVAASTGDETQSSDVIGEADIYIAYGRYPQAIALLQGAVESNPRDNAVRMRLLEVSAETKDAEGYATHARALREHCSDNDILAAADSLHDSLDGELLGEINSLGGNAAGGPSRADSIAGTAAAVVTGAASVFAGDDKNSDSVTDLLTDDLSPDELLTDQFQPETSDDSEFDLETDIETLDDTESFAFDTTVSNTDADTLLDDADGLLTGEFDAEEIDDFDVLSDAPVDSIADQDVEFDLDDFSDIDLDALSGEIAAEAAAEFDTPGENTDQIPNDIDMDLVDSLDENLSDDAADFELDLEVLGEEEAADGILGGDLDTDFPDETEELARLVAETDDDELLDEIERSLEELEADGLLAPKLDEEVEFSFDDDADTSATKLDLARAYIDMGDGDGAREILGEVISEGDTSQKGEANELLDKL